MFEARRKKAVEEKRKGVRDIKNGRERERRKRVGRTEYQSTIRDEEMDRIDETEERIVDRNGQRDKCNVKMQRRLQSVEGTPIYIARKQREQETDEEKGKAGGPYGTSESNSWNATLQKTSWAPSRMSIFKTEPPVHQYTSTPVHHGPSLSKPRNGGPLPHYHHHPLCFESKGEKKEASSGRGWKNSARRAM